MTKAQKMLALTLACCLGAWSQAAAGEAAKKKKEEPPKPPQPVIVEGEDIYYRDTTGELYVKGDALVSQGEDKVTAGLIRGNAKEETVFVDDEAVFWQPGTRVVGKKVVYNYGKKTGSVQELKGKVGKELISGKRMEIYPDHYVIYDASVTRCPAKEPDYRLTASKVVIWPNERLVSYGNKVWVKNTVLYSVAKNERSLRPEDQGQTEFPKIGYNSTDGLYIEHTLRYPFGDRITFGLDLGLKTGADQRTATFLQYNGGSYRAGVRYGEYEDGDDHSVWKQPEFYYATDSRALGQTGFSYSFSALAGIWKDESKRSWHQDYGAYLSYKPIDLSRDQSLQLHLGGGVQQVRESYDSSVTDIFRQDVKLTKAWGSKANAWLSWHNRENQRELFAYGGDDLRREYQGGFYVKLGARDGLNWNERWDAIEHTVYDRDITWIHNLHCWDMAVTYRAERNQWKVRLSTAQF